MKLPVEIKPEWVTAIIDRREQLPLDLAPLRTRPGTLSTGDYSVSGLEHVIAIERKSLNDLLGCVGRERERFDREVQRLLAYPTRGWRMAKQSKTVRRDRQFARLDSKRIAGAHGLRPHCCRAVCEPTAIHRSATPMEGSQEPLYVCRRRKRHLNFGAPMSAYIYYTSTPGTTSATNFDGYTIQWAAAQNPGKHKQVIAATCNMKNTHASHILPDPAIVGIRQALAATWKLAQHRDTGISAFAFLHYYWLCKLQNRQSWETQPPARQLATASHVTQRHTVYQRRFRRHDRTSATPFTRNPSKWNLFSPKKSGN